MKLDASHHFIFQKISLKIAPNKSSTFPRGY